MTVKERENLMKKVKPLENKLSNNKTCPGKNNKKQKKCTKWIVEVDRLRTALDNRVGGPCVCVSLTRSPKERKPGPYVGKSCRRC